MLLHIIVISLSIQFLDGTSKNRTPGNYDFLILVQSWPLTNYWNYEKKWINKLSDCTLSKAACFSLVKNNWVLHGLWADKNVGRHPTYCLKGKPKYHRKFIDENLTQRLNQSWLSYGLTKTEDRLWEFEWEKHGSCISDIECFNTMPKYFNKTLDLLEERDLGKILAKSNIIPGSSYELSSINQAIRKEFMIEPIIKCALDQKKEEQYLFEVRICMNRSLELENCGRNYSQNCNDEIKVTYPIWNGLSDIL